MSELSEYKYELKGKLIEIERLQARVDELEALTEADGKEIGSYRDGTGLRGENRAMMDRIAELEGVLQFIRDQAYDLEAAEDAAREALEGKDDTQCSDSDLLEKWL